MSQRKAVVSQDWNQAAAPAGADSPVVRSERRSASHALARAVSLHLEGKPAEALTELYAAVNRGEKDGEIYSSLGHIHFQMGQFDEAANSYWKLLQTEPAHRTASFNLAVCLEKLGRWEESAERFRRALDADPGRGEAFLGVGICHLQLGQLETALEAFDRCLNQMPAQEAAMFGKAVTLQLAGRFDEAGTLYRRILKRNPQSEDCMVNLIAVDMARKDSGRVRETAEQLLLVRPHSQAAIEGLAASALAAGDLEAAAKLCAKLVETSPDHFEGWFNLGVAHQKAGPFRRSGPGLHPGGAHPAGLVPGPGESRHRSPGTRRSGGSAEGLRARDPTRRRADRRRLESGAGAGADGGTRAGGGVVFEAARVQPPMGGSPVSSGLPAPATGRLQGQRRGLRSLPPEQAQLGRSAPESGDCPVEGGGPRRGAPGLREGGGGAARFGGRAARVGGAGTRGRRTTSRRWICTTA